MLRFAHIEILILLALIPLISIAYLLWRRTRRRRLEKFGDPDLLQDLIPDSSKAKALWKLALLNSAFIFLILAAARPQAGAREEVMTRKGIDLVIALDISNSMKAEDISPSRIERAKQAISKLVDRLQGDRIGIIVFAGKAYVQLPLTSDYGAAKLYLSHIEPALIQAQGTAIGEAMNVAVSTFDKESGRTRSIVVISDGENHEDDSEAIAKEIADQGILIYSLGIGSRGGVPIPVYRNGERTGFRTDREGNTVLTRLDENVLRRIAAAGGGKYILANDTRFGLDELFKEISKLEKTEQESRIFTDYEDHFQWPLAAAILLLLIEFLLFEKRSSFAGRWNIFDRDEEE